MIIFQKRFMLFYSGVTIENVFYIMIFQDAASVTADVLNAIHYLHSIGITHRDLKVTRSIKFLLLNTKHVL